MNVRYKAEGAALLRRAHIADAGLDVFTGERYVFRPQETRIIPLGFSIDIPYGFAGFLKTRTSLAAKGLHIESCPIDAGYTGEVRAIVTNLGRCCVEVNDTQALCQLVVQRVEAIELVPSGLWDLQETRGDGAFGSSDIKGE
jgi:dUTP pyrophosphatase